MGMLRKDNRIYLYYMRSMNTGSEYRENLSFMERRLQKCRKCSVRI
jgi:hypothetical protein